MPETKSTDSHHKACARMLMEDFGVPMRELSAVVDLIIEIYDSERFAHCLIINSVGGFYQPQRTLHLKSFLQEHGRRQPTRTKAGMLGPDEY